MTTQSYSKLYRYELSKIIPFLTERKYCYYDPSTRNGQTTSNYNLYSTIKPLIKTSYSPMQPDDFLKDNVVNVFTDNMRDQVIQYINNTSRLSNLDKLSQTSDELKKYHELMLKEYNSKIQKLNNDRFYKVSNYQSNDYNMNKNKMIIKLIVYSFILLLMILTIRAFGNNGNLSSKLITTMNISLFLIYLWYVLIQLRYLLYERSYTNWNRINFRSVKMNKDYI